MNQKKEAHGDIDEIKGVTKAEIKRGIPKKGRRTSAKKKPGPTRRRK